MKRLTLLSISLISSHLYAADLVYTPQNTAFGGNNANTTQLLMNKAQAQDTLKAPQTASTSSTQQTAIERFQASLERRILDQIAREIVSGVFPDNGNSLMDNSDFTTEEFSIKVNNDDPDVISVSITEFASGSETTMEIPKF